jgi:hypothetical protein
MISELTTRILATIPAGSVVSADITNGRISVTPPAAAPAFYLYFTGAKVLE